MTKFFESNPLLWVEILKLIEHIKEGEAYRVRLKALLEQVLQSKGE